jgi:DNA-binding response OmpR family regulator
MPSHAPKVLIIEDEPLICMDLEWVLADVGFEVITAASCSDAHLWLNGHVPDIAIVDMKLADGSSASVVRRLVEESTPFIVHSGDLPSSGGIDPIFLKGGWVMKPSSDAELLLALWTVYQATQHKKASQATGDGTPVDASQQPYELYMFSRKHGLSVSLAREIIRRCGSNRAASDAGARAAQRSVV